MSFFIDTTPFIVQKDTDGKGGTVAYDKYKRENW